MIGAVDEIGERLCACAGNGIGTGVVIAAPVAVEIPVAAADVVEVGVNHRRHLRGTRAGLADVAVTKGDAGAHDAERRCGEVGIFDFAGTKFLVDGVAGAETHRDGIVFGFAGIFGEMTIFHAAGRKESQLSHFQFAGYRNHIANGGRIRERDQIEFGDVRIAAEANAVVDHAVGREIDYGKLHAFLKIGVASGVDVERAVGDIFHVEDGWLLGCGIVRCRLRVQRSGNGRDE